MATKRSKNTKGPRRPPPERRVDVTGLEYQTLLDLAHRNHERIVRLEMDAATQFKRTIEQQAELDALKKAVFHK